ncbi:MAG: methyl-accepting chemotaxis protein [Clostridia bacterium]|nr:methyl-accepting chemotaxis protein [Clostridia bacterium]
MNESIFDLKKVNKLGLIIFCFALLVGGLPEYFAQNYKMGGTLAIWGAGFAIISPAIILYFIKKDNIFVRYFIGSGTFTLMYSLLYVQKGVIDNLFWLYVGLSVTAIFFDKWVAIVTASFGVIMAVVLYTWNAKLFFPVLKPNEFATFCFSLIAIGIIIAAQGHFGGKLILSARRKTKEANELNEKLQEVFLKIRQTSIALDGNISKISNDTLITKEETSRITYSIQQFNNVIGDLARGASDSSYSLSTIEQFIVEVEESTQHMNKSTSTAFISAQDGKSVVTELVNQIKVIENTINAALEMISSLSLNSKEIDNIAGLITGIASQINLLSLNASIEAARAGEAGKGFSVVAEEIRKLAEQTAKAVQGISNILGNITQKVNQLSSQITDGNHAIEKGRDTTNTTYSCFLNIIEWVGEINDIVENVFNKVSTLSNESHTVFTNIQNIAALSQEAAATMSEITNSTLTQDQQIKSIEDQMTDLVDLSGELKTIVSNNH